MCSCTLPSLSLVAAAAGPTHQLSLPLDLVLYCEAFLTTYRTFITPEELIKKLQYRYPFSWLASARLPLPASFPRPGAERWHQGIAVGTALWSLGSPEKELELAHLQGRETQVSGSCSF